MLRLAATELHHQVIRTLQPTIRFIGLSGFAKKEREAVGEKRTFVEVLDPALHHRDGAFEVPRAEPVRRESEHQRGVHFGEADMIPVREGSLPRFLCALEISGEDAEVSEARVARLFPRLFDE